MAPPATESKTLGDRQEEDLYEAVNYKSDTNFMGVNGSSLTILTGEDDYSCASDTFLECGGAYTLAALRFLSEVASMVINNTNPLDEQQQRIVAQAYESKIRSETMVQLASLRHYIFRTSSMNECLKEVAGCFLSKWAISLRPLR